MNPAPRTARLLLLLPAAFLLPTGGGSFTRGTPPPAHTLPASPSKAPSAQGSISWFAGGEVLFVPPYFDTFRDIDTASLTSSQKERFLHWVNTEFCSCAQTGCQRDTIANCYTNDLSCPRAPLRIREILEKVKQGAPLPGSPTGPPQSPRTAPN